MNSMYLCNSWNPSRWISSFLGAGLKGSYTYAFLGETRIQLWAFWVLAPRNIDKRGWHGAAALRSQW
ncbi:unnamed protein product [Heterosigma akashiwo]